MSYVSCKMAHARLTQLPLGSIQAQGWLKEQLERNKAGMGGEMPKIEPELIGKAYRSLDCHSHFQPGWTSEIAGTYWVGLIQLAFTLNDAGLIERATQWVHDVIALQEEDGFLGVHRKTDNRFEDYCAWGNNWGYRALLSYYDATGEKAVLEAVHRALLWFVNNWTGDKKTSYAGPVIVDSMVTVYHLTGDKRLLDWSEEYKNWLADHDPFHHGVKSMSRPRLNFFDDHVAAFAEAFKNPAILFSATGDESELAATRSGFRQVYEQCWQVTGAPSTNSEHFSPPSCIMETEYCNFAMYLNSFAWLGKITGEAIWFDRMEKILFNGAQGARMNNEKGIAYMTCPNQSSATSMDGSYNGYMTVAKRIYAPNYYVSCCPMQSIRIYPEFIRFSSFFDNGGAFRLAAYGPMAVKPEDGVEITLDTEYPFDDTITLRFKCATPWSRALKLRKPEWCREFQLVRNGEELRGLKLEEDWIELAGPWHDGDTLQAVFKMEARLAPVKDAWFPLEPLRAYTYGPLLFCRGFKETVTEVTEYPLIYLQANPAAKCPVNGDGKITKPISPSKEYPWYDISVSDRNGFEDMQWYAIPGNAKDGDGIKVVRKSEHGYPWDDSPVRLRVPLIRATNSWDHCGTVIAMPFGNPVTPDEGTSIETIELVPFGCTLLRQSCFPVTE